jgi:hypothetical protein
VEDSQAEVAHAPPADLGPLKLDILAVVKTSQGEHGLRHADYARELVDTRPAVSGAARVDEIARMLGGRAASARLERPASPVASRASF